MLRFAIPLLLVAFAASAADLRVTSDQAVSGYWKTGSLSHWSETGGITELATGFKGPVDFCVVPASNGSMTVVVPDLPQSQLRFIQLRTH